jgi:hypothetical protein
MDPAGAIPECVAEENGIDTVVEGNPLVPDDM